MVNLYVEMVKYFVGENIPSFPNEIQIEKYMYPSAKLRNKKKEKFSTAPCHFFKAKKNQDVKMSQLIFVNTHSSK